ncbi:MAG: hypothetical protein C4303_07410 [candidate division GAL15 bacterium]
MPFTVADLADLLRLLEQHPEWRDALRAVLLGQELLQLPHLVRRLAEAVEAVQQELRVLATHVQQLAEAQRASERRLARLEEAQERTDQRVARLEDALARLTEAQERTEREVRELARQVARLSEAVGFSLEELAREFAPAYLEKYHGIRVPYLERRYFTVQQREVEVDLYGEGTQDGEAVVVGEVRSTVYGRDVEDVLQKVQLVAPLLTARPVPTVFGFAIHPSAERLAWERGVIALVAVLRGPR